MHATKGELPVLLEAGAASIKGIDWGEQQVAIVTVPAGTDFSPLLKGLPNDRCQGPHWGYVLKGRIRIQYGDGDEVLTAGHVYYLPPDHTAFVEEDTQFLEVNPSGPHQEVVENALRNLAALSKESN